MKEDIFCGGGGAVFIGDGCGPTRLRTKSGVVPDSMSLDMEPKALRRLRSSCEVANVVYPLGPASPILLSLSSSDCAPGLGCPGATTGPACGVGAGGGTPAIAGDMTPGGGIGGGPGIPAGTTPGPEEGGPG